MSEDFAPAAEWPPFAKIFRPANGHYVAARLAAPPLVGTKFDPFGLDRIHYYDLINTVHLRVRLTGQSDIDGVYI